VRRDLGTLWEWLPEGALYHDPNAYSRSEQILPADRSIQIGAGPFEPHAVEPHVVLE
jgi:hypothetical protein